MSIGIGKGGPKVPAEIKQAAQSVAESLDKLPEGMQRQIVDAVPGKVSDVSKALVGQGVESRARARSADDIANLIKAGLKGSVRLETGSPEETVAQAAEMEGARALQAHITGAERLGELKSIVSEIYLCSDERKADIAENLAKMATEQGVPVGSLDMLRGKLDRIAELRAPMAGPKVTQRLKDIREANLQELVADVTRHLGVMAYGALRREALTNKIV